ncbi:LIM domain only protein 7-like isoform X6 [Takifugu flavidus]|uniref:LIM domain only protein 7-like isoform X6 n=1 Tax=Takifugu flavidus TaxID=433684 RepID=UPI0025440E5F|nr:LIM domain only protein 7-like isoform X6 [Takifugu flavidus]
MKGQTGVMEWREQSSLGCAEAYLEAQRWIEAVTKKTFGSDDFRSALENGILLCDLINKIKPGTIKRINRLPTPIAGLDNLNVFLRACGKLGLKDAQLFHPGDLQDLSSRVTVKDQETNRRLKNVLITIYWLGRRAQCDQSYDGPYLNFKAFEGLLGTALYKALHESPSLRDSSIRDSGFGDSWYSEREEPPHFRGAQAGGGGSVHKRDNSLDSLNSLSSQAHSISSDTTIKGSSEGCCSDTEADSVFKMTDNTQNISYRRSVSITPKATAPFNQFLPSKDKSSGYVPAPLRKKRAERNEDIRHSWASASTEDDRILTSSEAGLSSKSCSSTQPSQSVTPPVHQHWTMEDESGSDSDADRPDPDLVLDDLASRRFRSPSPTTPTNFAVPASPGGMGSAPGVKGGPWAKVTMTPSAPLQNVTSHRSKSTNDIQLPVDAGARRYELLQKFRDQIKESESQWQDDLSKWKNRRRSVNSDIVKKKEEREKIEQITSSDNYSRRSKTFREMQDERETKGRLTSLSYLEEDVFDKSVVSPQPRKFPARSQTIDSPYYSYDTHDRSLKQDEPPTASTATGRAASPPTSREVDIVDGPAGRDQVQSTTTSTRHSSFHSSQSTAVAPLRSSLGPSYSDTAKTEKTTTAASSFSSVQKVREPTRPLLRTKAEVEIPSSGAQTKYQPQPSSMESNPPALSRVSASLPRSYQRSDSARLTSVVAPRPFGAQTSRITSLPRAFTVDDPQSRVNGDGSKKSAAPSRYQQFMTSEDEADSSSAHSSNEEEEEEEVEKDRTTVTSTSVSTVLPPVKDEALVSSAPVSESVKESHCEMRISLNQKPNSSRDFGFQAVWDSTGARVMSVQPGSQAEMCQLQAGDEVLTVNRHQVAEMSYTGWKSRMEEALQEGSLVMDIRRHGKDNWDRAQPSLPFKSHKTINLTSTDHPILLGSSEKSSVNASLDFTSRVSTDTQAPREPPTRTVIDVASSGVNGGFCEEPLNMRNKESESISLKNLKRRSEFFEKGGPEAVMPDILVPPIVPPASRWSWDPEEERRRQEKWQKEQERLLQEKYKRDQEKLQAEWLKAQQEIAKNTEQQQQPRTLAVNSQSPVSISPRAPLSPLKQATSHPWEEEERKRKEEQEQQWQAERRRREEEEREQQRLQAERRRREEEEREQQRLQAERRRKEEEEERERQRLQAERRRKEEEEERERQQLQAERRRKEEEERRRLEEEELLWQKRRAQEREDERRRQEAAEQLRRERERAAQQQQQWHGSSYGFSNSQSSLSFTDRMKSKSTPQLDQDEKTPWKGVNVQQHLWWERPLPGGSNTQAQSQRAASEQDLKRRYILDSIRIRTLERANSRAVGDSRGQQPPSQANVERQQILNEMKKKIPLLTDSSWIRQGSSSTVRETNLLPMRRGESLDNLDAPSTWRSSWTPRSNAFVPNHNPLPSAFSGSDVISSGGSGVQRPSTLLSSYSVGHLRGGAGMPSFPSSKQSPLPSPLSPTRSAEPWNNAGSSVSTVRLNLEAQRRGQRSEYEINNSTVTSATCDSKLPRPLRCDLTLLQQIDEETTCDNNP